MTTLPGTKTLLIGESGAGKSHVIRTLLRTGIQPLVLALEPGMRSYAPCDNAACVICKDTRTKPAVPWAYVCPQPGDIKTMIEAATLINTRDLKFLCNINDTLRAKTYTQYIDMLKLIENFTDSTGKSWGNVAAWNTDRCLIVDGQTSINTMAMDMFVGRRPAYDKSDYQVAQRAILGLHTLLTCQMRCHVVMVAHPDRGEDEFNRPRTTIKLPGKALGPELPRLYDDMVYAEREGAAFKWNTATVGAVSKQRNLPIKSDLVPDLGQIIASWQRAGGKIEATEASK